MQCPHPTIANFRQRAHLWPGRRWPVPMPRMKGSVPHSELQHGTALQINLLSPLHSGSFSNAPVPMDNLPQERLTPTPPLLREQSYTNISRTSTGCFAKEDLNNRQYTRTKRRTAQYVATTSPHMAKNPHLSITSYCAEGRRSNCKEKPVPAFFPSD